LTAAGAGATSFIGVTSSEFLAAGAGSALFVSQFVEVPVTLPESNIYFIGENHTDSASLTATTTASGFDVDYLQQDIKSRVWRSTATTSQTITATWGTAVDISAVALAFTNLSAGSTVQIKLYTNSGDGSPVYDSGTLSVDFAYDPPTGFTTIGLAAFAYGSGTYFSSLFALQTVEKMEVIIVSSGNTDGYIEVSRLICGEAYTPQVGASYGAQISYEDSSQKILTDSGDVFIHRGTVKKSLSFNLGFMSPVDKYGISNLIKNRGASGPVFVSMYENSTNPEERQSFMAYGTFDQIPATAISNLNIYNANVSIMEV